MTRASYALRLQASLKAEAERVAKRKGTPLNPLINVALAEKLAALRTVDYLRERAARANLAEAQALLDSFGTDEPPPEGDELYGPSAGADRSPNRVRSTLEAAKE